MKKILLLPLLLSNTLAQDFTAYIYKFEGTDTYVINASFSENYKSSARLETQRNLLESSKSLVRQYQLATTSIKERNNELQIQLQKMEINRQARLIEQLLKK
jgi:hypothetical protein